MAPTPGPVIGGLWVPLVTPMRAGSLDLGSLRRLTEHLLGQGVDGVVACGSTGECASLREEEQAEVVAAVAEVAGHRMLAGVVASSTAAALARSRAAVAAGAPGVLLLTPTLLGAGQQELADHYRAVADAAPAPVLIYHFPARTGVVVGSDTALTLAEHPNIVGTKQSVSVLDAELQRLLVAAPPNFAVLIGTAALFWPALALGAAGGILAAANVEAPALVQICRLAGAGDLAGSREAHRALWPRLSAAEGIGALKRALQERGVIATAEVRAPLR